MNELNGYDIEDMSVGMSATFSKTITEADIVLFASASGDNNAMHINEEFAQTTQFKGRIAHGMLTASVISAAIAGRLPGPGTVYLGQNLRFKAPVRPGDTVHATVTVKAVSREAPRGAHHDMHRQGQGGDRRRCAGDAYFPRSLFDKPRLTDCSLNQNTNWREPWRPRMQTQ
jgi:3-hydroxybutyryl-CoA dehydratase